MRERVSKERVGELNNAVREEVEGCVRGMGEIDMSVIRGGMKRLGRKRKGWWLGGQQIKRAGQDSERSPSALSFPFLLNW